MNISESVQEALKIAEQFEGMAQGTQTSAALKNELQDAAVKARSFASALVRVGQKLPPPAKKP
jgi:hypothetical protein